MTDPVLHLWFVPPLCQTQCYTYGPSTCSVRPSVTHMVRSTTMSNLLLHLWSVPPLCQTQCYTCGPSNRSVRPSVTHMVLPPLRQTQCYTYGPPTAPSEPVLHIWSSHRSVRPSVTHMVLPPLRQTQCYPYGPPTVLSDPVLLLLSSVTNSKPHTNEPTHRHDRPFIPSVIQHHYRPTETLNGSCHPSLAADRAEALSEGVNVAGSGRPRVDTSTDTAQRPASVVISPSSGSSAVRQAGNWREGRTRGRTAGAWRHSQAAGRGGGGGGERRRCRSGGTGS